MSFHMSFGKIFYVLRPCIRQTLCVELTKKHHFCPHGILKKLGMNATPCISIKQFWQWCWLLNVINHKNVFVWHSSKWSAHFEVEPRGRLLQFFSKVIFVYFWKQLKKIFQWYVLYLLKNSWNINSFFSVFKTPSKCELVYSPAPHLNRYITKFYLIQDFAKH